MNEKTFNVFLSYHSEDVESVEKIAVYLEDRAGFRPWLDKWRLIPGESWLERLEHGLKSSLACAVFVGKSGKGPWQKKEVAAALDRQAKNPDFRVIPVLLPDAPERPELPVFLSSNTWVEFRRVDDDDAFWRLECGIRGRSPGRGRPKRNQDRFSQHSEPRPYVDPSRLIQPGGAMDVDSRFYIKRTADNEVFNGIKRSRGLVTVRGPRQTGKTSLILQAYVNASRPDKQLRPVFIDFQTLSSKHFESRSAIWRVIAAEIYSQLELKGWNPNDWDLNGNYDRNLSRFLDQFVFEKDDAPMLLCMDEVDRVFSSPMKSEFFASVRAFYNRGAFDPAWKKVRWLLSTSSEPSFFIEDLTQSPFNIGLRIELNDFTAAETMDFARRHGLSFDEATIGRMMDYLGGRPYLVHLLLYQMAMHPESWEICFDASSAGGGIFLDHLKRYVIQFQEEPELAAAMKRVIAGEGCEDVKMADRLEAAGLARRDDHQKVVCFCGLYRDFFGKEL